MDRKTTDSSGGHRKKNPKSSAHHSQASQDLEYVKQLLNDKMALGGFASKSVFKQGPSAAKYQPPPN